MAVPSQLNSYDHSLLRSVRDMMSAQKPYHYLEIGSWLGGSLQYHLSCANCVSVLSVDIRSRSKIKDERMIDYAYAASTQDMLDTLVRNHIPIDKLTCVDGCIDDVVVDSCFDLVFIDGEHTNKAAYHDAVTSLSLCGDSALILFHDAWIVHEGIDGFLTYLGDRRIGFRAHKVKGSDIMGVAVGSMMDSWHALVAENSEDWNIVKESARSKLPQKEIK